MIFKEKYVKEEATVEKINNILDALGIGVFTVAGTSAYISLGFFISMFMGLLSSIGGSVTRDVILGTIPVVLRKRIYALACMAGSAVYYVIVTYFMKGMPTADVVGTLVYSQKTGEFTAKKGPVFTNLLLADEINRAPAKVQSALLEAMQERQVTIGDETYALPAPFLVLATQNPIEQEGTYPLPEAQVDRFMFKCLVETPSKADERRIMQRFAENATSPEAKAICNVADVETLRATLKEVYCDEKVGDYILDIVFKTREKSEMIQNGASPRATLALNLAARGNALLHARAYATPQDVKEVVHDVLRHRILLTYEAEAEGITSDKIIDKILSEVPVP
jgi:MoxR-like ATPase